MDKSKEIRGIFKHNSALLLGLVFMLCAPISLLAFMLLLAHEPREAFHLLRHAVIPLLSLSLLLCVPGWRKVQTGELTLKDGILSGKRQSFFRFQRDSFVLPLELIDSIQFSNSSLEIKSGQNCWRFSHLSNAKNFADEILPYVYERRKKVAAAANSDFARLCTGEAYSHPPRRKPIKKQTPQAPEQASLPEPQTIEWDDPFHVGKLSEEQTAGVFVPAELEQKEQRFLNGSDT